MSAPRKNVAITSRVCNEAEPSSLLHPGLNTVALSRRQFVQAALALPAFLGLPAFGTEDKKAIDLARTFFSLSEYRFIEAATARLIPGSPDDPGAIQANVPFFIDLQLAGPYGRADRLYMAGPWAHGTEQQGYQSKYTPAQLYRKAIASIDDHCRNEFQGKPYAALTPEQQDQVLHELDDDKIELGDVSASGFFSMLWQNTQEGFLSDPMYGGNRDFVGWKLIGFPGPRYNYTEEITQYGKPYPAPPVGIMGRDGTRLRTDA
jgi:gluconate 2-dehydrogenase gamma chain